MPSTFGRNGSTAFDQDRPESGLATTGWFCHEEHATIGGQDPARLPPQDEGGASRFGVFLPIVITTSVRIAGSVLRVTLTPNVCSR